MGWTGTLAALAVMAPALIASGTAAASPATLCKAGETIVYSCSTGTRLLSICASKNISKNSGYLQYRYGPSGKPELIYPETARHPAGLFTAGSMMFSGGGGAYLRFSKAPYVYTVFSAIGNWGASGKATVEGVAVQKDGKEFANISCRKDGNYVSGEFGPEFFDKIGLEISDAGSDFDIPASFFPK